MRTGENKARRVNLPLCWYWWCLTFSSIFRLSSYMADINSNKNAIIIQPITLQIRAPFQFLNNQRAIKHTHYSESRDGLNGRCSFSVVCVAREYTLALHCFIQYKSCKSCTDFTSFSPISLPLFQVRRASVLCQPGMLSTVQISTQSTAVEVDLSDFVVAFKFIYFKYIYTRERLLLAKSAKQSKGKGVSRSQLQCQATTALRKSSVHLNRAGPAMPAERVENNRWLRS